MSYARDLRIRKELASGTFGIAYLADALTSKANAYGSEVVLKQLKKEKLSERDINLFRQEVSLMEYFKQNQNIAKIIGFTETPFAIVMKYYALGNLKIWITKHRHDRNKPQILAFAHDIAIALMALHGKGVCHLDLKPDNILLDSNEHGQVFCVLTDFGISQIITDQIMKVQAFEIVQIKGLSMAYAAPDRLLVYRNGSYSLPKEVIMWWDLYSFSIVLIQMINGRMKVY